MIIRRPHLDEIEALKQMHEPYSEEFKFPDIDRLESIYVIIQNEVIIGFGALQPIYEGTVVLNKGIDRHSRLEALGLLQHRAEEEMIERGESQIHVFVQNKRFENLLKNRFGYKETKGNALVKVIENG